MTFPEAIEHQMKIDLQMREENKALKKENEELKDKVKQLEKVVKMAEEVLSRYYISTFPMYLQFMKDAVQDYKSLIEKQNGENKV